jgi:hypothetical protein
MQGAQKVNFPKFNEPMKKWEKELNRTLSNKEIQMNKKTHEKNVTHLCP